MHDDKSLNYHFALIGTPVGHSLSPVMHNAVYNAANVNWDYVAIDCPDEDAARHEIAKVRTGAYRGMNVTMPYKQLAMQEADFVDVSADAAGGANVLVRKGFELHAFNTDGLGAARAIAREGNISLKGKFACVCGTGPTSAAITCALITEGVAQVTLFSRSLEKAQETIDRLCMSLPQGSSRKLVAAEYDKAWQIVPGVDVVVDATPRGMNPGDEAIVDVNLLRQGQVVFDVVYGHGETALLAGARAQGAVALDGMEMLVEQAALAIEIWQENMGYQFEINRDLMRGSQRR